jgi:GDPmannose 4,6-dehydratase
VELLIGDATKAKTKLGWQPQYSFAALVKEMVNSDVALFGREKMLKNAGYAIKNQFE